jgi:1,4-dihydroxy-6-naphthoate synthase
VDQTFTLGHSPDPDDAFMFYALAEGKIDARGYRFEHILQDIETLNERATRGELHISAISIHAYAYVLEKYSLLSCGASIGDGYGPLVIARAGAEIPLFADEEDLRHWLKNQRIAIPGTMTTAYLTLRLFLGEFDAFRIPFDRIFASVASGEASAGLIIHEGQLTYGAEGFIKLLDLGEWWKRKTSLPLPLGGNVVRKDLPPEVRRDISEILHESIRYGLQHRASGVEHAMPLARNMQRDLVDRFIGMYVNDFTLDFGDVGRRAVHELLASAHSANIIPAPVSLEFV